jgi:large subunit ribosomal protein L15
VNVAALAEVFKSGAKITPETLAEAGLIKEVDQPVVILGDGELKAKLQVSAHRFTKSAREKIEGAGGSVTHIELALRGARATIKKLPKAKRPDAKRA